MQYSKQGLELTESFEGLRLTAYQDSVGVWTIGYGHTRGVHPGMTCTQEEAEQFLLEDVQSAVSDVNRLVLVPLSQNQFDALIDFVFNVGGTNFSQSRLLRFLNVKDYHSAANEFLKWDMAGGKAIPGLLRRRVAEQKLFLGNDNGT